ncbi:hypothetical protein LTR27_005439 [Elasticomyces elasticus]|nr:hypothetical protein LTR27_005439 [Elasticomyces elasticus]
MARTLSLSLLLEGEPPIGNDAWLALVGRDFCKETLDPDKLKTPVYRKPLPLQTDCRHAIAYRHLLVTARLQDHANATNNGAVAITPIGDTIVDDQWKADEERETAVITAGVARAGLTIPTEDSDVPAVSTAYTFETHSTTSPMYAAMAGHTATKTMPEHFLANAVLAMSQYTDSSSAFSSYSASAFSSASSRLATRTVSSLMYV